MFLGNGIFAAGPNLALLKMGGFTFFQQGRAEFGPALTHLEDFLPMQHSNQYQLQNLS